MKTLLILIPGAGVLLYTVQYLINHLTPYLCHIPLWAEACQKFIK